MMRSTTVFVDVTVTGVALETVRSSNINGCDTWRANRGRDV
jgi:hypothetical protein